MSTMAILLLLFMSLLSSTSAQSTTALPNNQSLYFDPISKLKIVQDHWNLVVYYDISPYWTGLEAYRKLSKYIDSICNKINKQVHCNVILLQQAHTYQELLHYNEVLLGQYFNDHTRRQRRRGLIDGVGNIANSLFGVLDSKFAERYTNDIELIRSNERHLNNLWKNQTSVIEGEFNLLKRLETSMEKQHKSINKQLNSLEAATNIIQTEIANLSIIQEFTVASLTAYNLLQTIKQLQDTLLDTITDIYQGQISLHLLTPKQLKSELQIINSQMSKELTLPINNVLLDLQLLYRLLRVKTRVTKEYIIFEISLPLVCRDDYQIYMLIPVPHQQQKRMLTITPISKYIAFNHHRDSYISMNAEELRACILMEDKYICSLTTPIHHLQTDENLCISVNETSQLCQTVKQPCTSQWIPLHTQSQYFYFCCDAYAVKVICNDQVSIKQLSGSGIMTLNQNCIIKSKEFTLQPALHHSSKLTVLQPIVTPNIDQINHIIRLKISSPIEDNNEDEITIAKLAEQIKEMRSNTDELDSMSQLSHHDVHQYSISYIAIVIAAGIIVVWLYRRNERSCWARRSRP